MKTTFIVFALATLLTVASQGATTITGIVGSSFKDEYGDNITAGSLCLLIVDTGNNGFLNQPPTIGISSSLVGQSSGIIGCLSTSQAGNLSIGSSFGGDTIINTFTASGLGVIRNMLPASANFDITPYVNMNFALVWFTTSAINLVGDLFGQNYGIMKLADWTLPAADGGNYTMSTSDSGGASTYYSASSNLTATQLGASGFFSGTGTASDTGSTAVYSAQLHVIPEPSSTLLGAFGLLGFLRRRCNCASTSILRHG